MSEENAASEQYKPLLRIYDKTNGRSLELENVEPGRHRYTGPDCSTGFAI